MWANGRQQEHEADESLHRGRGHDGSDLLLNSRWDKDDALSVAFDLHSSHSLLPTRRRSGGHLCCCRTGRCSCDGPRVRWSSGGCGSCLLGLMLSNPKSLSLAKDLRLGLDALGK